MELVLNFIIRRSKALQVYVVGAAITLCKTISKLHPAPVLAHNCPGLATTAFLIIVAATLVYSWNRVCLAMLIVPVGALFAFSSIRAHLPGALDGFGG